MVLQLSFNESHAPCDTGMVSIDSYYISVSFLRGLVLYSSYFVFFLFLDLFHYYMVQYVHKILHGTPFEGILVPFIN